MLESEIAPELPIYDALTGAYSRALFDRRLPEEISLSRRHQRSCALCLFDLDYFKSINDAYGHSRGDQVLREVVERALSVIRKSDLLFRYGGDEFVLLLPNTTAAQALPLMRRLMEQIAGAPFGDTSPLMLSLSMGLATYPDDADDPTALFERADHRNGLAKRRGRRQIAVDDGEPTVGTVTPQRLIERDQALDAGLAFLDQLPSVGAATLRVAGVPGAGTSSLVAALAETAQMRGYAVLRLAGTCASQSRSYGALMQSGWPLPPLGTQVQIREAILSAARARGAAGLVVSIDSAEHLDGPTVALLRDLRARRPTTVALIYTLAEGERDSLAATAGAGESIAVQPLSEQGALIWLRQALRAEPPAPFLEWFHRETGGRPAVMARLLSALFDQALVRSGPDGTVVAPAYDRVSHDLARHGRSSSHNLPAALTDLVGRETEAREVFDRVLSTRMVSLLGPGGIGKTRLALQVATELACDRQLFPDGVWFVPLASVERADLVVDAIARALGLAGGAEQQVMDRLRATLRERRTLLVLDNFEHVTAAAARVAELLDAAPHLHILATSRSALRIYGEQTYAVPALGLPPQAGDTGAQGPVSDALALFVSRARLVAPDLDLDADQLAAVAAICARLDGLPLAIELAAARCDTMSPAELDRAFHSALDLSAAGPRGAPRRQQALREAIAWSYRMLAPLEQILFARLSVFAGGFTPAAAEAVVCAAEQESVGGLLAALVRSSLVRCEIRPDGTARYLMLETIREFAHERLAELGDLADVRRRHAEHFAALCVAAEPWLWSAQQLTWVHRLEADHANLRAALEWLAQSGQTLAAARMVVALWRVWAVLRYAELGRAWVERLLLAEPAPTPSERARLLLAGGTLAWQQGDYDEAAAALDESISLCRALGHEGALSSALNNRGLVARERGDYDTALVLFAESLALRRANGQSWGAALTLGNLARVALYRGELDQALEFCRESLALFRALGDRWGVSMSTFDLGEVLMRRRDLSQAQALLSESLALARDVGDRSQVGATLIALAEVAEQRGDVEDAFRQTEEALVLFASIGDKESLAAALERSASIAALAGAPEHAAQLIGAVEQLRETIGAPLPASYRASYDSLRAAVGAALGGELFAQALAAGGQLTLAEAVAQARTRPRS